jgi:hypothetical protein
VQDRCPHCGNYLVSPVYAPVGGGWKAAAIIWAVVCAFLVLVNVGVALNTGGAVGWLVAIFALAVALLGVGPLMMIRDRERARAASARERRCRGCGFRWMAP